MPALPTSVLVAVIGAGAMGSGIAQVAATAGHSVVLFDHLDGAAERGRASILSQLAKQIEKGRISGQQRDAIDKRIRIAHRLEELNEAALVIEAIVEDLEAKRNVFRHMEAIVGPDAVLATNTSSLSITAVAAGLNHPERVAGFHFFNPAPVMRLVEIVAGLATRQDVLDCLFDTAAAWGKTVVHVKSMPGFIVNRIARPFYGEALKLLEEGAGDVATLDLAYRECGGFPMGPFELMDMIGHDVNFAVTKSVFEGSFGDPRYRPSHIQRELIAAGWLGRKAGRGFYDYALPGPEKKLFHEPGRTPRQVRIQGNLGAAEPLVAVLQAGGVPIVREEGSGLLCVDGATLALTDGRSATIRSAEEGLENLVLLDIALDYATCSKIVVAKADQALPSALASVAGLLHAVGKELIVVDDAPGLLIMRMIAMLANEAAEAIAREIATPEAIDLAMTYGVNYPKGPIGWADSVGATHILRVLDNLRQTFADERYRASPFLRRCVARRSLLQHGSLTQHIGA